MNDSPAFQVPLVGSLGGIILWLLFFNVLLIGMVIFLAYRSGALRERVREMDEMLRRRAGTDRRTDVATDGNPDGGAGSEAGADNQTPPQRRAHPLTDDRPIPTTRTLRE
jgi:hypothetical protein